MRDAQRSTSFPLLAAALVIAGLAGAACQAFRPYPPDFHYVSGAELRTVMDRIARDVTELEGLLHRAAPLLPHEQEEVVRLLGDIGAQAATLDAGEGVQTNHPMLDERLPQFLAKVEDAKRAAEAEPPNYYLAGTVSGACIACHQTRR